MAVHYCFRFAEQIEIVLFAGCKCRADYSPVLFVNQHLRFHRVPFFLAAIPFLLFFWGVRTEFRLPQPTPLRTAYRF
jgi:hypothetical protein